MRLNNQSDSPKRLAGGPLGTSSETIASRARFHLPFLFSALLVLVTACAPSRTAPSWTKDFGYSASELNAIVIGEYGFPYVPVRINGVNLILPFDTGNMVGLSISSSLFDELGLVVLDTYQRRNSAGDLVATLRVGRSSAVTILGRDKGPTTLYEFDHPSLPGLVGPSSLSARHFTVDYSSNLLGTGSSELPDAVDGFQQIPLVRSTRHPLLILVVGAIEGQHVLIELDTGKSRTVINPALVSSLGLARTSSGVEIGNLEIGDLSFSIQNAKEVDQSAIDPGLAEPILVGIGSDILSTFIWTVDYESGTLWIPERR